ncbi:hypothetical protein [Ornithinibacillus scapharcae]|uniref:hypothetical protein n=1 Tax=Ornithinibacillus scapharcae TaxID=1147159 RepID=UPI000225B5E0|nr:hypothetical protein [Ornithinibacillus scapharcae]
MDFDKMKDAVKSIEMPETIKSRVKKNSNLLEKEKSVPFSPKKWISVACAIAVLLLIIIGFPLPDRNGNIASNFTITAYASSVDGNQLYKNLSEEKAIFELATEQRMGLITSVADGENNLIFTDVILKVTGEQIESITYTLSEGKFIEDVIFTAKERADKEWLLSEKIYMMSREPGSDVYQGIKEVGNTYTVNYNEQEKHKYTLAIPHDGNYVIDEDIVIQVIVKYTGGNMEQQNILVTQESDSISLTLK